jgi:hypothetical protein
MRRKKTESIEPMSDRERILMNIAATLACELSTLQRLPAVQEYLSSPYSLSSVRAEENLFERPYVKGDLVVCATSARRRQNPWIISFVEEVGIPNDPRGLCLRAIGRGELCNYGNESFIKITGIPERLMYEGAQQRFVEKLGRALQCNPDSYSHRYQGVKFTDDYTAVVSIGEVFGGIDPAHRSKPYLITIPFTARTSIKMITAALLAGGLGTRKFEPEDESPVTPHPVTKRHLVDFLETSGISTNVTISR